MVSRKIRSILSVVIVVLIFTLTTQQNSKSAASVNTLQKVVFHEITNHSPLNNVTTKPDSLDLKYKDALKQQMETIDKRPDLVGKYVNPSNNTIFVTIYQLNEEKLKDLESLNKTNGVSVIYRNSDVSLADLMTIKEKIWEEANSLSNSGIEIGGMEITANSTVAVSIVNLTPVKAETFEKCLSSKIPLQYVSLFDTPPVTLTPTTRADPNRPVIAGVEVDIWSHPDQEMRFSTMGFYVSWYQNGAWKEGCLIAGHAACNDNSPVYAKSMFQGAFTYPDDVIATFKKWGSLTNPTADVALYKINSTAFDGKPSIWISSAYPHDVYGTIATSSLAVNDWVELSGDASNIQQLQIQSLHYDGPTNGAYWPYSGTMKDYIKTSLGSQPGDSGAPIYQKYLDRQAGIYMCYASGICSATLDVDGTPVSTLYSSVDNIANELNVGTIDYTTDR